MADIVQVSSVSHPAAIVLVDGIPVVGLLSYSVDDNSFFQANTFNFVVSLAAQVAPHDVNWWSQQTIVPIEIYGGFPVNPLNYSKADLSLEISGISDDIEIDFSAQTITITGRDLTSKLIDVKRATSFITQPLQPSNIVQKIAESVGLQTSIVPTNISVGAYTQIVKSIVESNATLWDIVCKLAQVVGYVAYTQGNTLYFHPKAQTAGNPYFFTWNHATSTYNSPTFNGTTLKFGRNGQAARDIKVTVMSVSTKGKHIITATTQKTRVKSKTAVKGGTDTGDSATNYTIVSKYALTQDQAQAIANAKAIELSLHEMRMETEAPADTALNSRRLITVRGTNTQCDQDYYPSSIVKSFSLDDGYRMTIHAKNASPDVEFSQ